MNKQNNVNRYIQNIIIERPEYKTYRRKKKIRSIFSLILITFFWIVSLFPNNPETTRSDLMIVYVILALFTFVLLLVFRTAFFVTKLTVAKEGVIKDIQVNRKSRKIEVTHFVECDDKSMYRCDSIENWNRNKGELNYEIGDSVYIVSIGSECLIMRKEQIYE